MSGSAYDRSTHLVAPKDNSDYAGKHAVRNWLLSSHRGRKAAYEVFGSGQSTVTLQRAGFQVVNGPPGDALASLNALTLWNYDWWDVDPWGSPWPALAVIAERATASKIAIFLCDGGLIPAAKWRAPWPSIVAERMGWDQEDKARKAWAWCHYEEALRQVVAAFLAPRFQMTGMRVAPRRIGNTQVRYAGVLATRSGS